MRVLPLLVLTLVGCREQQKHCDPEAKFPADVAFGPQLALAAPDGMTIAWRTTRALVGSVACAGKLVSDPAPTREHVLRVEGLAGGTTYPYRIRHDGAAVGEEYAFTTPPAGSAPFRFAVIGDSGSGCEEQFAVAARIAASRPAFVLHTGDVAYPRAEREMLRLRYFVPYADLLPRIPFYPSHGDHDTAHEDGAVLRELLYLPGNERYFAFDWGDARLVVLDTILDLGEGSEQHRWLAETLAKARKPWTIVCLHHPPYSSSHHRSIERVRPICPLMDRYGVDLVLSGNDHNYERTFPLRDGRVVGAAADPAYRDAPGTVYVVTGGGGQILYPRGSSFFTAVSHSVHHTTLVDVEARRLTVHAVTPAGREIDRFTLEK